MNIHEYQAKELLAKFGVPVPAGYAAMSVEEAVAAAGEAPRAALRGQGADPRRRPRQGQVQGARPRRQGRRAAGADAGRGARGGGRDARQHARHRPDRARRASRSTGSTSPTASTSPRNSTSLCWSTGRAAGSPSSSRPRAAWTSRRSPTTRPEKIHSFTVDPATGFMPHHGRAVAYALGLDGRSEQAGAEGREAALRRLPRHRRRADRDQPARRHRRRQAARARRQGRLRCQRRCSAIPTSKRCATRARRTRWSSRRRNTTSPTSSSTAISAAWSTAPASPWRRWTSSS